MKYVSSRRSVKKIAALALLAASTSAGAASFNTLDLLSQEQFRSLSETVAASIQYKGLAPAEPLGILGFDVAASVSYTEIENDLFDLASEGDFAVEGLLLPRVSVQKGLPFGWDIGASLSMIPSTDVKVMGAEVRYAIMEGGVALPAVGVRASFSILSGIDELDVQNQSIDISVSKGFLMFTPYAGAGIVRTTVTPNDSENLVEEEFDQKKMFVGLNVNLGINFSVEADRTGDDTSYSAKVGLRF